MPHGRGEELDHSYNGRGPRNIGPSGVRALPLASGINVGGHYFRYFPFLTAVVKIPEGDVVGFQLFAWAPK